MHPSEPRPGSGMGSATVFEGAVLLGDLVEGLYGPDGRYKLVETADGPVVASDLHRLLDELSLDHPGARLVASGAVHQKEVVGDGSLTLVLLARGLAERAQELVDEGFHRATVASGFDQARQIATTELPEHGIGIADLDDVRGRAAVRDALGGTVRSDSVVDAAVEAAELVASARHGRAGGLELDQIEFRQVSTTTAPQVELLRGVFLDREPVTRNTPTDIENARIAVIGGGKKAGSGIEERELKRAGGSKGKGRTEVSVDAASPDDLETFRQYETDDVQQQVQILVDADVDAVFTTMGISDRAIAALDAAGIVAFRNLQPDHARRLSRATGASIVMHFDDLAGDDVGAAGRLRIEAHEDDTFVRVDGCDAGNVGTLLVSGTVDTGTVAFQRDVMTAVVTGLAILDGGELVPGGGGTTTRLAADVRDAATSVGDRSAMVMAAYADALEDVPRTLARNAGADPLDILPTLRAADDDAVFDGEERRIRSVGDRGPFDLLTVLDGAIDAATDVAIQLVRIDDVLPATSEDDEVTDFNLQPDPERDVP